MTLQHATNYLEDLIQAFGQRSIVAHTYKDGEEVKIWAKDFVRRRLTSTGMKFPYHEMSKPGIRIPCAQINEDQLTIILHKAIFSFQEAYIREYYEGNPQSEPYIQSIYKWIDNKQIWLRYTFPLYSVDELLPFVDQLPTEQQREEKKGTQEAKNILSEYGFTEINSFKDANRLIWELAFRRVSIDKKIKKAVQILSKSSRIYDWFIMCAAEYNRSLNAKAVDPHFKLEKFAVGKIKERYSIETIMDSDELKIIQNKIKRNLTVKNNVYGKMAHKIISQLKTPNSRFHLSYDFTNEKDIEEFISWYNVIKRPINKQTINQISREIISKGGSEELFQDMVESYNFDLIGSDEIDEEDDEF